MPLPESVKLVILLISGWCLVVQGARSHRRRRLTAEEQLIMDLFRGYDTDARAVVNTTNTVSVQIQFILLRIQTLDERSQVLVTTGLVIAEWRDERLTWDPKLYNNITDVVVIAQRIWTPELAIINGANEQIRQFEKIRVLINHTGGVHWEPGGVFGTTCDIDITYFPFDTQDCSIEVGAWAYKSSRMNLTNVSNSIEMQEYKRNGEWSIKDTLAKWDEVVLPCCPGIRYSKVVFSIHMYRRHMFYVMNIILPCILLSTLILVVFCVPPDAGEKISAGISVLLAFTVFMLMLADNVPRTSLNVPILVMYLGTTMGLGTLSICLTVFVLNLHHRGCATAVPRWACRLFLFYMARLFGLPAAPRARAPKKRTIKANNYRIGEALISTSVENLKPSDTPSLQRPRHLRHLSLGEQFLRESGHECPNVGNSETTRGRIASLPDVPDREATIKEWQLLARVFDRIFFWVVASVMFSSALFILLSPWYFA